MTIPPIPPTLKVTGNSKANPIFTLKPGIAPIKIPTAVPANNKNIFSIVHNIARACNTASISTPQKKAKAYLYVTTSQREHIKKLKRLKLRRAC